MLLSIPVVALRSRVDKFVEIGLSLRSRASMSIQSLQAIQVDVLYRLGSLLERSLQVVKLDILLIYFLVCFTSQVLDDVVVSGLKRLVICYNACPWHLFTIIQVGPTLHLLLNLVLKYLKHGNHFY